MSSERTPLTYSQLRQNQYDMIQEQDAGLEAISRALGRTKQIGLAIGSEIDDHNILIDDIHTKAEKVDYQLKKEDAHVNKVSMKASTGGLWLTAVLLLIAIIVLAVFF